MTDEQQGAAWPRTIYRLLKEARVTQISYVPDGGHKQLIRHCADDPEMRTVSLTTEQDGIGMATGAWLAAGTRVEIVTAERALAAHVELAIGVERQRMGGHGNAAPDQAGHRGGKIGGA